MAFAGMVGDDAAVLELDDAGHRLGERAVVGDEDDGVAVFGGESPSRSMISWPVVESRFPVGSSASRIGGVVASARAIATRCCSPPESWEGRWLARLPSPTAASSSSGSLRAVLTAPLLSTFWRAVSVAIRLNCWNTKPIESRRSRVRSRSLMWLSC